jgi:hypothetical protein
MWSHSCDGVCSCVALNVTLIAHVELYSDPMWGLRLDLMWRSGSHVEITFVSVTLCGGCK